MQEHNEDTRESDALGGGEVRFDREDAEAIGDPAAASVEAEGAPSEPGAEWQPPAPAEQTPAAADARGAEQAESPPLVPIAGAFVGAFVAAKLLGKLGGGDD